MAKKYKVYICKVLSFSFSLYLLYTMFKDPVCKMMVDEKTAENVSEVDGKKVYLCSARCKEEFDKNPGRYGY
jgi:YHS domain-containing protein